MKKLNLTLSGVYTDSDSGMHSLGDYAGTGLCEELGIEGAYNYDLSNVHHYSELDIKQTELSLRASYQVDKTLSLGCGLSFLDYSDDDPYLFDASGDAYLAYFSISYYPGN